METYHVRMSVEDFKTTVEAENRDVAIMMAIQKCEQVGDVSGTIDVKEVQPK